MSKIKAIGLFSGGLDSLLAIKLIEKQGVPVIAVSFVTPFFGNVEKLKKAALSNKIKLKIVDVGQKYIDQVLISPEHGYGRSLNPCIDCKIFMIKEALRIMKKEKAKFIFTGEVLGQRPMSQRNEPLAIIKDRGGFNANLLRPLSAKLLPETEAEKKGWIKREALLGIQGRGRKKQFELAEKYGLKDFGSPAGGCLLAEKEYSRKLKDLLKEKKGSKEKNIRLLKAGRIFRLGASRIIVGKNERDNEILERSKTIKDYTFQAKQHQGPVTLLSGPKTPEAIKAAAALTARYSDAPANEVIIKYGSCFKRNLKISKADQDFCDKIRIS